MDLLGPYISKGKRPVQACVMGGPGPEAVKHTLKTVWPTHLPGCRTLVVARIYSNPWHPKHSVWYTLYIRSSWRSNSQSSAPRWAEGSVGSDRFLYFWRASGPGPPITHACTGRLSFDIYGPNRSPDHTALPNLATEGRI